MDTESLIDADVLEEAAPVLRTVAHPVRLRILDLLKDGELTVLEIAAALEKPQALTSHHLAILRRRGVLAARREGHNVHYAVRRRSVLGLLDCIRRARLEEPTAD